MADERIPSRATWLAELAREHPTLIFTGAYIALTLVGMIYSAWLFLYFRINIIQYSQTSDFLLAAIRTPFVIILAVLPALIVLLGGKVTSWARRKYPRYDARYRRYEGKWWGTPRMRGPLWTVFAIVYAILFTQLYASRVAASIKGGNGRKVRVEFVSAAQPAAEIPTLIGTTQGFVFLFYPTANETRIVPFNAVASITVAAKKRKAPR